MEEEREKGRRSDRFLGAVGCAALLAGFPAAASPARFSSKGQMCSQQLVVATPSRELPSRLGLLACSCRLAEGEKVMEG